MKTIKCINKNRKRNLTLGKVYDVEAEVFNIETMEIYAVEFIDDKGNFTELPIECVEVIE